MWVRSQNKKSLVDVKGFYIDDNYSHLKDYWKENKYTIVGWAYEPSTEDNQRFLGMYNTKEKAMSVLDELQCRIARSESGVFQMPEDEE